MNGVHEKGHAGDSFMWSADKKTQGTSTLSLNW